MKKSQVILFLLLTVLLSSCYTNRISYQYMERIQPGMSRKEVVAILGEPIYRSFDAKCEILEFRNSEYGSKVIKIWFVDNKVTEMKGYLENCDSIHHNGGEIEKEKKEDKSTEKDTSSKIRVTTDGKHIVQMGSIIVTPEGKHEMVVSDQGGVIITASGEHIHAF